MSEESDYKTPEATDYTTPEEIGRNVPEKIEEAGDEPPFPDDSGAKKGEAAAAIPADGDSSETRQEFRSKIRSKARMATVLSIVAVTVSVASSSVSIVASYLNYSSQQDNAGREIVKSQYDIYYKISQLEIDHWQMGHLFALPGRYEELSGQVRGAVAGFDEVKKTEFRMRERAVARVIFTHYEQTLIERDEARKSEFEARATLLEDDLRYYTDKVLPNPRLRYLWSEKGGGLGSDFVPAAREHYEKRVLTLQNLPSEDQHGPFK